MKKMSLKPVWFIVSAALIVGCSGAPKKEEKAQAAEPALPLWIASPETQVADGAFGATECVLDSGNFSLDKAEATANARAALAQQIDIRVQTMDKTYKEKIQTTNKAVSGTNFSSVSKQIADQGLKGSRVIKLEYLTLNNRRQLCAMVELNPAKALELFKTSLSAVEKQNGKIPAREEEVLYQEFKQKMAIDELEASLKR
jgi:hypothetical protein